MLAGRAGTGPSAGPTASHALTLALDYERRADACGAARCCAVTASRRPDRFRGCGARRLSRPLVALLETSGSRCLACSLCGGHVGIPHRCGGGARMRMHGEGLAGDAWLPPRRPHGLRLPGMREMNTPLRLLGSGFWGSGAALLRCDAALEEECVETWDGGLGKRGARGECLSSPLRVTAFRWPCTPLCLFASICIHVPLTIACHGNKSPHCRAGG